MGLDLVVGVLAALREEDEEGFQSFLEQFDAMGAKSAQMGLPLYVEPESGESWDCQMYGYSGLHYLRRVAAHLALTGRLPEPGDNDSAYDPVLQKYYRTEKHKGSWGFANLGFDHLILHSDCDGFYLPVDFEKVAYMQLPGQKGAAAAGSSARLEQECRRLASVLEIPEQLHAESEELWKAAEQQGRGPLKWQRYGIESYSCVCLLEACRKSMELKAAIVFT